MLPSKTVPIAPAEGKKLRPSTKEKKQGTKRKANSIAVDTSGAKRGRHAALVEEVEDEDSDGGVRNTPLSILLTGVAPPAQQNSTQSGTAPLAKSDSISSVGSVVSHLLHVLIQLLNSHR